MGRPEQRTRPWVAEVAPELYSKLTKRGSVGIGWISCRIEDFFQPLRCVRDLDTRRLDANKGTTYVGILETRDTYALGVLTNCHQGYVVRFATLVRTRSTKKDLLDVLNTQGLRGGRL